MAVKSNVTRMTIKHVQDPGDPVDIPIDFTKITSNRSTVTRAYRTLAPGLPIYKKDLAMFINIIMESVVTQSEAQNFLRNMIEDKEIEYCNIDPTNNYFIINWFRNGYGWYSGTFYLEAQPIVEGAGGMADDGSPVTTHVKFKIEWVEAKGIALSDNPGGV